LAVRHVNESRLLGWVRWVWRLVRNG